MFNEILSEQQQLDNAILIDTPKKESYFTTRRIAYIAMLIALSVVIGTFSPRIMGNKLTFSYTLNFIAGYFFGGVAGILVGGLGDLFGCLLAGYAPNPILLVSSCLLGLIPALVKKIKAPSYVHIIISYVLCTVICSAFINTYGLMLYSGGRSYFAYMAYRLSTQSIVIAINIALTCVLQPVLSKIIVTKKIK